MGYGRPRDKEGWKREVYENERRKIIINHRLTDNKEGPVETGP